MRLEMTLLAEVRRVDGLQEVLFYRRDDSTFTFYVEELTTEPGPYLGAEDRVYWMTIFDSGRYGTLDEAKRDAAAMIDWLELF